MSSVDVIVPCYRYGHFLKECVDSVLAQSGPRVRVVIIDDASPDNTAEVAGELARNDSRVTLLLHRVNQGHIATYNEGIEWVTADYLLLLSADDYLLPGALERATSLMETHPEVGFTFGNVIEVDENGPFRQTDVMLCQNGQRVLTTREFIELNGAKNIVPTPTAVIRTSFQKKVGGYRAELPHAGDLEMWLRLAACASVGFVRTPQAVYRRHANNMSLSYAIQHWLPDLEQRKTALDCFFEACGDIVPNSESLGRWMRSRLAREAVGYASAAFNDAETKISDQLASFAVQTYPRITRTIPWVKYMCKRRVGRRIWQLLQPVAGRKHSPRVHSGRIPMQAGRPISLRAQSDLGHE